MHQRCGCFHSTVWPSDLSVSMVIIYKVFIWMNSYVTLWIIVVVKRQVANNRMIAINALLTFHLNSTPNWRLGNKRLGKNLLNIRPKEYILDLPCDICLGTTLDKVGRHGCKVFICERNVSKLIFYLLILLTCRVTKQKDEKWIVHWYSYQTQKKKCRMNVEPVLTVIENTKHWVGRTSSAFDI